MMPQGYLHELSRVDTNTGPGYRRTFTLATESNFETDRAQPDGGKHASI
jgi:hypothetical protein